MSRHEVHSMNTYTAERRSIKADKTERSTRHWSLPNHRVTDTYLTLKLAKCKLAPAEFLPLMATCRPTLPSQICTIGSQLKFLICSARVTTKIFSIRSSPDPPIFKYIAVRSSPDPAEIGFSPVIQSHPVLIRAHICNPHFL